MTSRASHLAHACFWGNAPGSPNTAPESPFPHSLVCDLSVPWPEGKTLHVACACTRVCMCVHPPIRPAASGASPAPLGPCGGDRPGWVALFPQLGEGPGHCSACHGLRGQEGAEPGPAVGVQDPRRGTRGRSERLAGGGGLAKGSTLSPDPGAEASCLRAPGGTPEVTPGQRTGHAPRWGGRGWTCSGNTNRPRTSVGDFLPDRRACDTRAAGWARVCEVMSGRPLPPPPGARSRQALRGGRLTSPRAPPDSHHQPPLQVSAPRPTCPGRGATGRLRGGRGMHEGSQ